MNWNEMRRGAAVGIASLALLAVAGCGEPSAREAREPAVSLAVLVSVDQLPTYLLERYDSLYTGGFRRLLDEGRYYGRAVHDHGETWTSAGHPTLATGRHPANHGVVANSWYTRVDGDRIRVVSVRDDAEKLLGVPDRPGYSPRNLEATGLGDWLAAQDPAARVVSITAKPTASITLAGKVRGQVYWYEDDVGRFVTSTYYRSSYPSWVEDFNDRTLQEFYADTIWSCQVPESFRGLARRDDAAYENDGIHTSFPHRYHDEVDDLADRQEFYDWWDHTPALDVATLELVRTAIDSLELGRGRRGSVDYLAIGLSQNDRIGHAFGPYSLEQLDNLLRVDRLLGELLEHLDRAVGPGRYVLALSSDHGTPPVPAYAAELGEAAREPTGEELSLMRRLARRYAEVAGVDPAESARIVAELESIEIIADVITEDELTGAATDSFVALYQRSYHPNRLAGRLARYGLVVRYQPGTNWSGDVTTHGSPYLYDRQVPVILFGAGVAPGSSDETVRTVDVAPTLAELAGIPYPADLDGRPLLSR